MDAQTRHSLKTNELGEALSALRDFNNPYVKYSAIAAVGLLVVWIGWSTYSFLAQSARAERWREFTQVIGALDPNGAEYAKSLDRLRTMTNSGDVSLAGFASLNLARERVEVAQRDPNQRAAALNDAKSLLERTRSRGGPSEVRAASTFALATVHESLAVVESGARESHLKQARDLYSEVASTPTYKGSPYVALSQQRLEDLDKLAQPIVFLEGTSPEAPPMASPTAMPTQAMPIPPIGPGEQSPVVITPGEPGAPQPQRLTPEEVEELMRRMREQRGEAPAPAPSPAQPAPSDAAPAEGGQPANPPPAQPAPTGEQPPAEPPAQPPPGA